MGLQDTISRDIFCHLRRQVQESTFEAWDGCFHLRFLPPRTNAASLHHCTGCTHLCKCCSCTHTRASKHTGKIQLCSCTQCVACADKLLQLQCIRSRLEKHRITRQFWRKTERQEKLPVQLNYTAFFFTFKWNSPQSILELQTLPFLPWALVIHHTMSRRNASEFEHPTSILQSFNQLVGGSNHIFFIGSGMTRQNVLKSIITFIVGIVNCDKNCCHYQHFFRHLNICCTCGWVILSHCLWLESTTDWFNVFPNFDSNIIRRLRCCPKSMYYLTWPFTNLNFGQVWKNPFVPQPTLFTIVYLHAKI